MLQGLCLSGVETEDIKNQLKTILLNKYPSLSDNYYVGSDTRAPLAMVNDKGIHFGARNDQLSLAKISLNTALFKYGERRKNLAYRNVLDRETY